MFQRSNRMVFCTIKSTKWSVTVAAVNMAISTREAIVLATIIINVCHGTIYFKSFKTCDKPSMKVAFDVIDRDNYQLINGNYSSKIVNGENLKATMTAKFLAGPIWKQLFHFNENRGVCALLDNYIGPLFHDGLKAAGMLQGCPLPAGTFHWKNYRLNTNMMKLALPPGKMRIRVEGIEKKNNKLAICADVELENK